MSWVAVAVAGAGVLGAGASLYGANKQAGAAQQAIEQQQAMYQQMRADLSPYAKGGKVALSQLQGMMPGLTAPFQYQQSPGYQFELQQGLQAINKAAAARGNYYAPQTLQDIGKFTTGLAGTDYYRMAGLDIAQRQQREQALLPLIQQGQAAAAGQASGALTTGQNIGNLFTQQGAAQAGGMMGAASALGGAGLGLAGYGQFLAGQQMPTYAGVGGATPDFYSGAVPLSQLNYQSGMAPWG